MAPIWGAARRLASRKLDDTITFAIVIGAGVAFELISWAWGLPQ